MKTNVQLQPTVFAIFGGSGDLTWRKLMPSLFDLFQDLFILSTLLDTTSHKGFPVLDSNGRLKVMITYQDLYNALKDGRGDITVGRSCLTIWLHATRKRL